MLISAVLDSLNRAPGVIIMLSKHSCIASLKLSSSFWDTSTYGLAVRRCRQLWRRSAGGLSVLTRIVSPSAGRLGVFGRLGAFKGGSESLLWYGRTTVDRNFTGPLGKPTVTLCPSVASNLKGPYQLSFSCHTLMLLCNGRASCLATLGPLQL